MDFGVKMELKALDLAQSRYHVQLEPAGSNSGALLEVTVSGDQMGDVIPLLPVRASVLASDGHFRDGSGHGLYLDGRFFVNGTFSIEVPPGPITITLSAGPNFIPLKFTVTIEPLIKTRVKACLHQWFSPEDRHWYCGDSHIHAQHDPVPEIVTGYEYAALQARANGLDYVTESGYTDICGRLPALSNEHFMFRYASELHAGLFTGHLCTPGIARQITAKERVEGNAGVLPVQNLLPRIHELGGLAIYTHPLEPAHQLHWMGATESFSDAVMHRCADAMDIGSKADELLWFTILNLGNRLTCSGSTDSALERRDTFSPGDRRVYCLSDHFTYEAMIRAIRLGRTFTTNGGPIFVFFAMDRFLSGDTVDLQANAVHTVDIKIHCLHHIRKVELFCNGNTVKMLDVAGQNGILHFKFPVVISETSWYIARAEDEFGNWCITSPIYFSHPTPAEKPFAYTMLMELGNFSRHNQKLQQEFFIHTMITISPDDAIREVQLFKNKTMINIFDAEQNVDPLSYDTIPVTQFMKPGTSGAYKPGWIWYPNSGRKVHFQVDWPLHESGWYAFRVVTISGRLLESDLMRFDQSNLYSHELSSALLASGDTIFHLSGYGEEILRSDIGKSHGDHWWYMNNASWCVTAKFGQDNYEVSNQYEQAADIKSSKLIRRPS